MSEWFKEPVLKTGDTATYRGFESHPIRQGKVFLTVLNDPENGMETVAVWKDKQINSMRARVVPRCGKGFESLHELVQFLFVHDVKTPQSEYNSVW